MQYLVSFIVLQSSFITLKKYVTVTYVGHPVDEEKRAGCFTLLVFLMSCDCVSVLWLFLMVPLVGLKCVNVVFPGYAHLLLKKKTLLNK